MLIFLQATSRQTCRRTMAGPHLPRSLHPCPARLRFSCSMQSCPPQVHLTRPRPGHQQHRPQRQVPARCVLPLCNRPRPKPLVPAVRGQDRFRGAGRGPRGVLAALRGQPEGAAGMGRGAGSGVPRQRAARARPRHGAAPSHPCRGGQNKLKSVPIEMYKSRNFTLPVRRLSVRTPLLHQSTPS